MVFLLGCLTERRNEEEEKTSQQQQTIKHDMNTEYLNFWVCV